ncbi:hypothetical protein OIU84_009948 [Salix udensis]|uniref:Pentatricopeptide repeat-containing protein n=1 Tax=Salix udensis TaxID=889485 RepID=A0AAD6JLG7_9ROSI|nr:hypothetical protein OIU84_009948 [Salix udensis]
MISCFVLKGMYREALDLFDEMLLSGVLPDEITMVSLFSTCTKLKDLETGKRLHLYIVDNKLRIRGSLLNCLVDMYSKCGKMDEANSLLSRCDESEFDVVLWTTLVSGYVKSNKIDKARQLFEKMNERSLVSWTTMMSGYVQVLSACAHLEDFDLGKSIHAFIVTYGMIVNGFLGNALLDLYAKCGKLDDALRTFEQLPYKSSASWNSMLDGFCRSGGADKARDFFNKIPEKDIVSWNTMVNFYVKHDMFNESFELFCKMQSSNVKPDRTTLISLLSSCANVGALYHGIWANVYIEKNEIDILCMLQDIERRLLVEEELSDDTSRHSEREDRALPDEEEGLIVHGKDYLSFVGFFLPQVLPCECGQSFVKRSCNGGGPQAHGSEGFLVEHFDWNHEGLGDGAYIVNISSTIEFGYLGIG